MRKTIALHLAVIMVVFLGCPSPGHSQDAAALAVIVNGNNPITNLSVTELRQVLLGERKYWAGSQKIIVLMPRRGSPERGAIMHLLRMNEGDYKKHWLEKIYAGDAEVVPTELPANGTAIALVSGTANAIAIVPAVLVKTSVKIAKIDGLSPTEAAYPIR